MRLYCKLRSFVGVIPRAGARRESRAFLSTTVDCRSTQSAVLQRLLALNSGSRFNREHGLDTVKSVSDFRRALPVNDYEYFRPYIEDLKQGNFDALLGRNNKLLMFSLSSGTTAQSKFIPITQQFLDDYRHGWQVWGINVLDDHPNVSGRTIVQFSSDYDRFRTPGGTPCGNISGLVAAAQKRIVRSLYTVPRAVAKIEDSASKNYTSMRLAIADDNVGLVMTANPSTLVHLSALVERQSESLLRDIADGTLSRDVDVSTMTRELIKRHIGRKNPRKARELARIFERTGRLLPRDYWPNASVLGVWSAGSVGAYLPSLRQLFGSMPVRDHGLSASEGRMTIPLDDNRPEGVLDVSTHFFEFIPEEEYETEHPTVLEAHELEAGRNYYILLTTSSGLYRYDICDVVRCTGFYRTTPCLVFLHKGAHIASVTGEKISESQVVAAVRDSLEATQLELQHFTVAPVWGTPPQYQLLAEERDVPTRELGQALAAAVDRKLQLINCEYHERRQSGRLGDLSWHPIPTGTWQRFAAIRQSGLGGCMEQYKHPCISPHLEFVDRLYRDCIQPPVTVFPAEPLAAPQTTEQAA